MEQNEAEKYRRRYLGAINLAKLEAVGIANVKTNSDTEMRCLCIPIEQAGLVEINDNVYIEISVHELAPDKMRHGSSHLISQTYTKEVYESMSRDERMLRNNVIGSIRPVPSNRIPLPKYQQVDND